MNILLKGYYGFGNFGDDLLMLISYRILKEKYPDSSITIFSNNTENIKEFRNKTDYNNYIFKIIGEKVPLIDWTVQAHFDLIFEGGGGTYFDSTNAGWLYCVRNRVINKLSFSTLKKIDTFLRTITNKKRRVSYDKRIALGIGIGPFNKSSKNYYSNLIDLSLLDFIMVRDKASFNFAEKLKTIKLGGDLAFFTHYWSDLFKETSSELKSIGFILKENTKINELGILKTALLLKKSGWDVHFFAFDEAADNQYINECKKYFKVETWLPHEISLKKYILQLQKCSILFTERAHGAIVGSVIGCVPYFISSSYKLNQILSFFNSTADKKNMVLKTSLDTNTVNNLYKELESRKLLLKIDVAHNNSLVSNSIKFVF